MFTRIAFRIAAVLVVASSALVAHADNTPVGTMFTYQGRLTQQGNPVTGSVDLVFQLYATAAGGSPLATLTADDYEIGDDGRFTIDLDFGNLFTGEPRWLAITVNSETLLPRQPIMPAPYAMVATTAANVPSKAVVGNFGGITGVGTLDSLNVSNNVGIGTLTPQAHLHIDGTGSSIPGLEVQNPGSATGRFVIGSPVGTLGASGFVANGNRRDIRFTDTGLALLVSPSSAAPGATNGLFINESGNVGIGTTDPLYGMHVNGSIFAETTWWAIRGHRTGTSGTFPGVWGLTESASSPSTGVRGEANHPTPGANVAGVTGLNHGTTSNGHGVRGVHNGGGNGVQGLSISGTGVRGISQSASGYGGIFGDLGTPGRAIMAVGQSHMLDRVGVGTTSPNSMLHVNTVAGTNPLRVQRAGVTRLLVHDNSNVGIGGAGTPLDTLHVFGTTRTNVIRIMGGSDLAERFDVADVDDLTPQPGMIVCIDPANPGKLIPSTRGYDRTVAGVISGANGINSGMIMGQEGSEADGQYPVALTGRVYVLVDATAGAIEPGDMLTTSDRPGHAMKVNDFSRSQGAIIGKAMTSLAEGEIGYVMVLVNLQ